MSGGALAEDEAELRRRLSEAEETLRAIREGEVDALVVRGPREDEVFALGGGQDSYRAFMEAMDLGAAALDADERLIYANAALCNLLGQSSRELQRSGLFAALGEAGARSVKRLIDQAATSRQSVQILLACGGGDRHVEVTVALLSLSFSQGYAVTFTDVTERIEAAVAEETERVGRAIMTSSNEAVVVCDRRGVVTHTNSAVRQFREETAIGLRFAQAFPFDFPLGAGLMHVDDLIEVPLAGTSVRGVEGSLAVGESIKDVIISAAPLRQVGGTVGGCIVNIIDVSQQKAIEKRQKLLLGELAHRVKNTLTLVLSISNRTIAGAKSLADFQVSFGRRLEALAATHNLLAHNEWVGLTLEDLIGAELAPYVSLGSERISLRALKIRISTDIAVTLGLIFHELVTNAVKYGALSNDTGRISIDAQREAGAPLNIVWREIDGPPVVQPEKTGFGQTIIARGLRHRSGGGAVVEFLPDGVVCRMVIPAADLD